MKFFNTTVSRTASFSVESFDRHKNDIISFFEKNTLFQLSISIASQDLYKDLKKNKKDKVKTALENYFKRAHFNAVPFGTFSKVGTLQWGVSNKIHKSNIAFITITADNSVFTKELSKALQTHWMKYLYYTNPTIHFLSQNRLSYYKTNVTSDGNFKTEYAELDFDENIEWVINQFKKGAKIQEITNLLENDGFEISEINNYLTTIIEAGLIINSCLFPPRNTSKLLTIDTLESLLVKEKIHTINSKKLMNSLVNRLTEEQDKLGKENAHKNLYMVTGYDQMEGHIHNSTKEKIKDYINFTLAFNHHHKPITEKLLEFGREFYHHFNDDFVPLSKVFNPKCGLQYNSKNKGVSSALPKPIFKKIITSNNQPIYMDMPDVKVDHLLKKLDPTFSVIYELLKCKKTGKEIIYFKSAGGGSALKMLGRFTNVTEALCKEIASYEESRYSEQIVAEINMLIKPRLLNVFAEKRYYKHVIPLNTVFDEDASPIYLEDLYLKFDGYRFILISKEKQKEVIPSLTSAVNYHLSNSDLYRFLCDLQYQNRELTPVNFNMNSYDSVGVPYIPRIYLKDDILLRPAQLLLVNNNLNLGDFKVYVSKLMELYSFPNKICVSDKKGTITLDFENEETFLILHKKILKLNSFYISESLYSSFTPQIKQDSEHFAHELYSSIKNIDFEPPQPLSNITINVNEEHQNTPILSEWLYLELYCNTYGENEIINAIMEFLPSTIELFFFVRYNYPKNHLRVRFKTQSIEAKSILLTKIEDLKRNNLVLEYLIKPYHQELGRYGGEKLMMLSEKIFHLDSLDTFNQIIKHDTLDQESIFLQAIFKIKYYFDFFSLTLDEMILQCELSVAALSKEFPLDKVLRKSFNKRSKNILVKINEKQYHGFLEIPSLKSEITLHLQKRTYKKKQYISDVIHMSMNRLFNDKPRFNEFQSYYLTLNYLKKLKFTEKTINTND
ncbi:lantibiotic dehydratase [Aquimarina sp. 2304DJ70-9]|uniref:lantibiotic dehydratase n=1 Tax=Aquimarina penaris TaxID=3231044 RepID=UPI003462FD68